MWSRQWHGKPLRPLFCDPGPCSVLMCSHIGPWKSGCLHHSFSSKSCGASDDSPEVPACANLCRPWLVITGRCSWSAVLQACPNVIPTYKLDNNWTFLGFMPRISVIRAARFFDSQQRHAKIPSSAILYMRYVHLSFVLQAAKQI